jgi:hypothetical protein
MPKPRAQPHTNPTPHPSNEPLMALRSIGATLRFLTAAREPSRADSSWFLYDDRYARGRLFGFRDGYRYKIGVRKNPHFKP